MPKTKHPEPSVAVGELWRCGAHVYLCSDLMDQDEKSAWLWAELTEGVFMGVPRPTLVYTDPPWGQGLANGFRTKAGLGRAEYGWTDIYRDIAALAHSLRIPAWYEGPVAESRDGMKIPGAIMTGEGFRHYERISYFGGNPSGLYFASHVHPAPLIDLENREGFAVVKQVLEKYRPGTVLDPCCGLGGIPLTAQGLGWSSVSNELNPQRMGRALARMADLTGAEPERIA